MFLSLKDVSMSKVAHESEKENKKDYHVSALRRSFEAGHRPKYLVIVDETDECQNAVFYAARHSARTGANVVMLTVAEPPHNFEWVGVGEALREEAREKAMALLDKAATVAREAAGLEVECLFREGSRVDEIKKLIAEDEDIASLVLAAGLSKEGPGPLVSVLAGKSASHFLIPIVIVPGTLTTEELTAITG